MSVRFEDDPILPPSPAPAPKAGKSLFRLAVEWAVFAAVVGLGIWIYSRSNPLPFVPTPNPVPTPTPTPNPDPFPPRPDPTPTPDPKPDPSPGPVPPWTQLGRDVRDGLGREYAACWRNLATEIEAGRDMQAATQVMAKEWHDRRTNLFRDKLTPELAKLYPEPGADGKATEPTAEQRSAMAKAYRELADGLDGGK